MRTIPIFSIQIVYGCGIGYHYGIECLACLMFFLNVWLSSVAEVAFSAEIVRQALGP